VVVVVVVLVVVVAFVVVVVTLVVVVVTFVVVVVALVVVVVALVVVDVVVGAWLAGEEGPLPSDGLVAHAATTSATAQIPNRALPLHIASSRAVDLRRDCVTNGETRVEPRPRATRRSAGAVSKVGQPGRGEWS
jgi:hypothetical protein